MQDRHASVQFSYQYVYVYRVGENLQPTELANEGEGPPAAGAKHSYTPVFNFLNIHVLLTCMGLFVTSPRFSASCFVRMGGCGLRPIQRHARLPVSSRAGPRPVQHQLAHEGGLTCFCILGCRHTPLYTTCCTRRQRRMGSGSSGSTCQPPD